MKRVTVSGTACAEILGLLVEMAWVDGRLSESEKEGVRGAAAVLNLTKELRDKLDALLESPRPADELMLESLSPKDQALAYVAAAWLAGADRELADKERALLEKLRNRLGFSAERGTELEQVARDLEPPSRIERRWSDELVRLFKAVPPRLLEEEIDDDVEVIIE